VVGSVVAPIVRPPREVGGLDGPQLERDRPSRLWARHGDMRPSSNQCANACESDIADD
jgi:hypothetical protein